MAHRLAQMVMSLLAVAVVAMVLLIFDVVSAFTAAVVAAGAATVLLAGLWVALPLAIRERGEDDSGRGRPPPLSAVGRPRRSARAVRDLRTWRPAAAEWRLSHWRCRAW